MIDTVKVGRTISQLRRKAGMTQAELADVLFVTHQSVSKWETGAALPDITTLFALCHRFGISMDALLTGDAVYEKYTAWRVLDMIGDYLSEEVKDLLFDGALRHETLDTQTGERLLKHKKLLNDAQQKAVIGLIESSKE